MRTSLAAVGLLLLPAAAGAQGSHLQNVRWLEGCWEMTRGATRTIEKWSPAASGVMPGESRTFTSGADRESEKLRLFTRGDTLVYEAIPSGQRLTEFKTVSSGGSEIIFANPAHDFPQRIVYRRISADSIVARIEGDRDNRRQPVSFPFKKVTCPATLETPAQLARKDLAPLYADINTREAVYSGAMNGWMAEHAAPDFRYVTWATSATAIPVGTAPVLARADSGMRANPNRVPRTNVRFNSELEQVLVRGDSVDAMTSVKRTWNFLDSAGLYGPAGATREREVVQRRLDRWVKTAAGYKLREALVISDENSVDGRLLLKNGRTIAGNTPRDAAIIQTSGTFYAITVPSADSIRAWYVDKLGMRVILQTAPQDGVRAIVVSGGGLMVEIVERAGVALASTAAPGIMKAGFFVDDFDGTLRRLRDRGVTIVMGPFPANNGVPANVIIRDNAGTLIQLFGR